MESRAQLLTDERQRRLLESSEMLRHEAIARFILRHWQIAADLDRLNQYGRWGDDQELAAHLAKIIRDNFRNSFGHEMIAASSKA